jgi:hypothetical protein
LVKLLNKGEKMSVQHQIWLERAGLIKEDWEQLVTESYQYDEDNIQQLIAVYEEIRQVVEALPKAAYVSAMRNATDPEGSGDSDKVVARAKKVHGDKFAKDLESGAGKMHYPRDNHTQGYDKLANRKPAAVTKSGMANKTSIQGLKTNIKRNM